jgi:PTH2 family peptidyl-tRNA hydrolase
MIQDSGRTEFHGQPTLTACAIGPDLAERIDEITGDLTLY